MKTKVVHSENPIEHWSDISDVQDKIVMDLGCGWLFQPFQSTPEYFISRGAKSVIGVEADGGEVQKLKGLYPNHTFICKTILSETDLIELFETYRPEVIKMDIEGYESVIDKMTNATLQLINIKKSQLTSAYEQLVEYEVLIKEDRGTFFTDISNKYLSDLDFSYLL